MATTLDREGLKTALTAMKARIRKTGRSLEECVATVDTLPATLEGVYGTLLDDEDRGLNFAMVLAFAKVLGRGKATVVKGGLELEFDHANVTVYRGDLHVRGELAFARDVVVFGDLVVDGILRDSYEYMSLLVSGSVRARAIRCGHKLLSGGSVEADVIVVGSGGAVYGDAGVHAELAIFEDDAESGLQSTVKAKTLIDGDTMMMEPEKAIAKLRKVLVPQCFDGDDDEDFDAEPLFTLLRKGRPWARSQGAAKPPSKATAKKATAKKATAKKATAKKATAKKATGARYFECIDGTSRKFWEIRLAGKAFTTRYGRIGTDGQTTTKAFDSPAKAASEVEKLVGEKTRKGYVTR